MPDRSTAIPPDDAPAGHALRAQRGSVMLIAEVECQGGRAVTRHRVRDISSGGIRIDNAAALRPGTIVSISLGAIREVTGSVRWARDGLAGLAFDEPIDPENARKRAPGAAVAKPAITAPVASRPLPPAGEAAPVASSGWIDNLWDPYRRSTPAPTRPAR